ncbi:MAG: hypothetical protein HKN11_14085 [Rhizobiales bacterium]|nr:hypothetical protein [Hyphomicrobiales bacterium]
MSNTKWLRRALLGGVALSVMATGAQADELSALKAQLEALQSRVNSLEAAPAPAALPEGYSYMTYGRGAGSNNDWGNEALVDRVNQSEDRGFTIAVTPTADLPAPVAEVTVYGYVKGDVIYAFQDNNFAVSTAWSSVQTANTTDHITITAKQSRFGIKSKVDTAIGQIRTRIEGDFEGNNPYGALNNDTFRMRHAYGEWDMTENLTLIIGQTWRVASLLPLGISTVDFAGSAGWTYSRDPQVKIRYTNGPLTVHLGIEEPLARTISNLPVFGGSIQYDVPGGHQLAISGAIGEDDSFAAGDDTSWVVQGGANFNVADMATLTGAVVYGEGSVVGRYTLSPFALFTGGSSNEVFGAMAGVSFPVTDTTTFNVVWDYLNGDGAAHGGAVGHDELHTVHANIMWQPVKQMRMGWEVLYLWADDQGTTALEDEYLQVQWGTWFFF